MRYRREKTSKKPSEEVRGLVWLVSFPGYIVLLLCWVGVLGGLCAWVASWLIGPASAPAGQGSAIRPREGVEQSLLFNLLAVILVIVCLALVYWLLANLTARAVRAVAALLETSVWVIKFVAVPLGGLLASITAMLAWPGWGLQALAAGTGLAAIGLCSFGLEYALVRQTLGDR